MKNFFFSLSSLFSAQRCSVIKMPFLAGLDASPCVGESMNWRAGNSGWLLLSRFVPYHKCLASGLFDDFGLRFAPENTINAETRPNRYICGRCSAVDLKQYCDYEIQTTIEAQAYLSLPKVIIEKAAPKSHIDCEMCSTVTLFRHCSNTVTILVPAFPPAVAPALCLACQTSRAWTYAFSAFAVDSSFNFEIM